jgi:hypothetical protein
MNGLAARGVRHKAVRILRWWPFLLWPVPPSLVAVAAGVLGVVPAQWPVVVVILVLVRHLRGVGLALGR